MAIGQQDLHSEAWIDDAEDVAKNVSTGREYGEIDAPAKVKFLSRCIFEIACSTSRRGKRASWHSAYFLQTAGWRRREVRYLFRYLI